MLTAYSATTAANIPADARNVFAYANPPFAQLEAVAAHCPHARISPIVTHPHYMGEMYDCEPGALWGDAVPAEVGRALVRGVRHPIVYFSLSNTQTVCHQLADHRIAREQVRLVVAHYTARPELPDWADGVQWGNTTGPHALNTYQLRDDFFHWEPQAQPTVRRQYPRG